MMRDQEKELNKRDSLLKSVRTESEREIEKLKTEKHKADINHNNKELATSTLHLINKNEFIAHVKQNLTSLIKKIQKIHLPMILKKLW